MSAASLARTRQVSGSGRAPVAVSVVYVTPTRSLSATGSRTEPSTEAWEGVEAVIGSGLTLLVVPGEHEHLGVEGSVG